MPRVCSSHPWFPCAPPLSPPPLEQADLQAFWQGLDSLGKAGVLSLQVHGDVAACVALKFETGRHFAIGSEYARSGAQLIKWTSEARQVGALGVWGVGLGVRGWRGGGTGWRPAGKRRAHPALPSGAAAAAPMPGRPPCPRLCFLCEPGALKPAPRTLNPLPQVVQSAFPQGAALDMEWPLWEELEAAASRCSEGMFCQTRGFQSDVRGLLAHNCLEAAVALLLEQSLAEGMKGAREERAARVQRELEADEMRQREEERARQKERDAKK